MKKTLLVEGMSCGHCEKAIKEAVGQMDGVEDVKVDLEKKKVEVSGNSLNDEKLREVIEDAGYDLVDIN